MCNIIEEKFTLEVKRFYIPFSIKKQCPKCKANIKKEFGEGTGNYLSYPKVNEKISEYLYCDSYDSEFEVDLLLTIGVSVEGDLRDI